MVSAAVRGGAVVACNAKRMRAARSAIGVRSAGSLTGRGHVAPAEYLKGKYALQHGSRAGAFRSRTILHAQS